jgi:hypothetical protein
LIASFLAVVAALVAADADLLIETLPATDGDRHRDGTMR